LYCPVDGNIYLGEAQLWSDYNDHGDADLWGSISHEWGHRIQHVAGQPNSATPNEQIPPENQADCFSGAFLDYSARNTALDTPSTPDDLLDLFIGLFNIGDPRIGEETQDHGTIDQRIRAFYVGYNSADSEGAWACDFYVTSGSIIPKSRTDQTESTS
jgi:predicted metalloprotease